VSEPVFPDVLDAGLYVVFCGTAVADASRVADGYYAGRGNKFWATLHGTRLTPILIRPANYTLIKQYGLGLTDLAKEVSGPDSSLRARHFDAQGFIDKIRDNAPVHVAFNGLKAARIVIKRHELKYGEQTDRIFGARVWVLPSTSAAANGYWDERPWLRLAKLVEELRKNDG
jgi:TDG/mug DNA glycosylase family protein